MKFWTNYIQLNGFSSGTGLGIISRVFSRAHYEELDWWQTSFFFFLLFNRTIVSENNRIELFYDIQKVIEMILGRDVYCYSVNKNRNMRTRNLHIHVPEIPEISFHEIVLSFFLSLSFFLYFTSSRIRYESDWHAPDAGNDDELTSMLRYICFDFAY